MIVDDVVGSIYDSANTVPVNLVHHLVPSVGVISIGKCKVMNNGFGPEFTRFFPPIVKALREKGGSGTTSEIIDRSIELLGISESEQNLELTSGSSRVRNQAQWARLYMARGGILDSSKRGIWRLTELGNTVDQDKYDWRSLFKKVQRLFADERKEWNALDVTPDDDILQINPFVSFNMLFQCKRYTGSVTPSQIRDFRGTMMGRADKGLVVTTGTFTLEAKREARRDGAPPIELVDGDDLVRLFETLEFGLTPRTTYDVDESFFLQFND